MTNFLLKLFVPNSNDVSDTKVRTKIGNLASAVSIVLNIILFLLKLMIGKISMSVSIIADAFNNLSDASSNLISLVSFKISSRPADEDHPYGHARFEYLASMIVACLILAVSFELGKSSIDKIINPSEVTLSLPFVLALVLSVFVKLWMSIFNKKIGTKINSTVLLAAAADSRNDIISTCAVIAGGVMASYFNIKIDGYLGLGVALFICYSGISFIKESFDLIMGMGISKEEHDEIKQKIMSYDGILGVHDFMLHDYGANNRFGSCHVEMDYAADPMVSHEIIDTIERDLYAQKNIYMSIHYDPILVGDPEVDEMKKRLNSIIKEISPKLGMHDFRMVKGEENTNLIFDVVVPYKFELSNEEIKEKIDNSLSGEKMIYHTVITFDFGFAEE